MKGYSAHFCVTFTLDFLFMPTCADISLFCMLFCKFFVSGFLYSFLSSLSCQGLYLKWYERRSRVLYVVCRTSMLICILLWATSFRSGALILDHGDKLQYPLRLTVHSWKLGVLEATTTLRSASDRKNGITEVHVAGRPKVVLRLVLTSFL